MNNGAQTDSTDQRNADTISRIVARFVSARLRGMWAQIQEHGLPEFPLVGLWRRLGRVLGK